MPSDSHTRILNLLMSAAVPNAERESDLILQSARDDLHAMEMATDRLKGIPLAYLLERQNFLGIEFLVDRGVLIPRPETELLARTAIQYLQTQQILPSVEGKKEGISPGQGNRPAGLFLSGSPEGPAASLRISRDKTMKSNSANPESRGDEAVRSDRQLRLVDMCSGAGNLACALALNLPGAHVWAADIAQNSVSLARRNVARLGLDGQVEVFQGDYFTAFDGVGLESTIDAIVCNPPYIPTIKLDEERLELYRHEPREAFDGGPYGLSAHLQVLRQAAAFLRPGGALFCEFGIKQGPQIRGLFKLTRSYERFELINDEQGEPRVFLAVNR